MTRWRIDPSDKAEWAKTQMNIDLMLAGLKTLDPNTEMTITAEDLIGLIEAAEIWKHRLLDCMGVDFGG